MCAAPSIVNYSDDFSAHVNHCTHVAFENIAKIMCTALLFSTSQKSNALYNSDDINHFIMDCCIENCYSESTTKKLKIKTKCIIPSGSWIRKQITKIPQEKMIIALSDGIDGTISHLKKIGFLNKPVTVAIDKHFICRYDKKDSPYLIKSRSKNGTTLFEGYGTIQSVEEICRAQIGCTPIRQGDSKADIVRKLLSDCYRNGIATKQVLLDREFFSTAVIHELKQSGHTFVMPAVKTAGIKKAIVQYVDGDRGPISEYRIHSGSGHVESFNLVILPNPKPTKQNLTDQYLVFATNITRAEISKDILQIPQEYRRRWGIETGYACVGKFRPRTCSVNPSVRFLYFFYPLILFNAWIIANVMLRNNCSVNHTNPIITIEILKCIFEIIIVDFFKRIKPEYYLEDVR